MHMFLNNLKSTAAWYELGDNLNMPRPEVTKPARPDIDIGLVSTFHAALLKLTGPIREVLKVKRGYTENTIKRFQLGWDNERVTIPIYDEFNQLVNFRRYKWNDENYKLLNYADEHGNSYGEVRIFGIENLINEDIKEILWLEGETDRILAEQHGFFAACPTSGAGAWKPEWNKYFKNKEKVYVLQDNDKAGKIATQKICEKLYRTCDVYIPQWPEDFPDKGDTTDFFTKCSFTANDYKALLDNAVKYESPTQEKYKAEEAEATSVHLAISSNAKYFGQRVKIPIMVTGKDSAPFLCPKKIKYYCGDAADAENKKCSICQLSACAGEMTIELTSYQNDMLKLIRCTEKQQMEVLRYMAGVDKSCPRCTIKVEETMNLEEVRMIPIADGANFSRQNDYVVRTGYSISDNIKTNKRYTLVGNLYPDPYTQYATHIFDTAIPEKDFISEFEMSDDIHEQLKIFQAKEGQTILDKFNEIHNDLERNITFVWERKDVAFAADLIYHTALNFYFQGHYVKRGWGELLIIGDSGQAKTTLIERLMEHYRLGELHSGESSKRTGLVYSMQQTNKRWFLVWGAFPLNDGGLIVLDELSGLHEDDLALMSDVRSSGIAKATGVITAETNSRTRAIYISNPRNGKQLKTETYGVTAVMKLFGKAEDVRRLDLAMAVASGDVDPELVNKHMDDMAAVPHQYTSELCNLRVMWAWSRRPEHIKFEPDAIKLILKEASRMGKQYTSSIPIVEAADQRIKIARISIAAACCVYSTEDGYNVIVKKEHVYFVVKFMDKLYSSKSLGYDKLSDHDKVNTDATDTRIQTLREEFILLPLPDHNEMVETLYNLTYFSRYTLEDFTGLPKEILRTLLKFLTTRHIVEKARGDYRRLPLGTEFLLSVINKQITKEELTEVRKNNYSTEY